MLGDDDVTGDAADLAGSEYLELVHGLVAGRPVIDLDLETAVQQACRRAVREGVVTSAHDCSDGGLAVALAESCIQGGIGFLADFVLPARWDAALFGERQSRIVVSAPGAERERLARICREEGAPLLLLGRVGGATLSIAGAMDVAIGELSDAWRTGLQQALSDTGQ